MSVYKFTAASHLGSDTESHQFHIAALKYVSPVHTHDFYEVMLVTKGTCMHVVNDQHLPLKEGFLIFVRPSDIHAFEKIGRFDIEFTNLCFTASVVEQAFAFLGMSFGQERLLDHPVPPTVFLAPLARDALLQRMNIIGAQSLERKASGELQRRGLLIEILLEFFRAFPLNKESATPPWFEDLLVELNKKENFCDGIQRLHALAARSPAHVSRTFKKHLGKTPVEYVNALKLNEVARLLNSTQLSIIDISLATGFNNLSHFYHLFQRQFQTTPKEFRHQLQMRDGTSTNCTTTQRK